MSSTSGELMSTLNPVLPIKAVIPMMTEIEGIKVTTESWTNWGGNLTYQPEKTFHPKTLSDLQSIVRLARENGNKKIRCTGSGHSWCGSAISRDYLVSTRDMNKIHAPVYYEERRDREDDDGWTVTIETGVTVDELDLYLRQHNPPLCLPSNVLVGCVRYGGTLTMGCHGASVNARTMSDMLTELKIVNGQGDLIVYSETNGPEEFSAACLNLGLLGLIYTVTLKVEIMQTRLRVKDSYPSLKSIFDVSDLANAGSRLRNKVLQQDSIEFFYWPFKNFGTETFHDHIWCKQWERTTELVEDPESLRKLHENRLPMLDHPFFAGFHVGEQVMEIPDAIHFPFGDGKSTLVDAGVALKVDPDFQNVIRAFSELVEKNYEFSRSMPERAGTALEMRFIKASNKMLSPAYDEDPETIFAMMNVMAVSGTPGFEEYAAGIMTDWIDNYKAKPHWPKLWELTPGVYPYLRQEYGSRLDRFNKVREIQDPDEMFLNATFENFIRG